MSSCSCSNVEGLSLLDSVNAGRLYNTYNPSKVFIPLTTQLMYKVNNPALQQTIVQNAFSQPTFSQETTLKSIAASSENLSVQNSELLNYLKPEKDFVNSIQSENNPLEIENNLNKELINTTTMSSLTDKTGSKIMNLHEPESVLVNKRTKNNDNSDDYSDFSTMDIPLRSLVMLKNKIEKKEMIDELVEYAQIWDKLIYEKEQSKEMLLEFRTKALEIFGENAVDHFEKNIGLNDSYKDILHLSPNTTAQSSLKEFYKSISGNSGEAVYVCINGSNVQKSTNAKCPDGFKLHKYTEPFTIDPAI